MVQFHAIFHLTSFPPSSSGIKVSMLQQNQLTFPSSHKFLDLIIRPSKCSKSFIAKVISDTNKIHGRTHAHK